MDDLDAHPSALESEAADQGSGSKLPLLAMVIALIGIVFGLAGIYMGAQASNALKDYQDSLASRPDKTTERLSAVEASLDEQVSRVSQQLASVEERMGAMGAAQVALQRTDREMRDQTQRAFEGVSREVSANRTQLNETTARLEELIQTFQTAGGRRAAANAVGTRASSGEATTESGGGNSGGNAVAAPEEGFHVVAQGDTLSSIASRYGISLSQLMAANPNVDPRRMRIGQQIAIPQQ